MSYKGKQIPLPQLTETQIARFWANVQKTETCWIWTGIIRHEGGYGVFCVNNTNYVASRIAYYLHTGIDPLENHVLHHCDVKLCAKFEHLFLGDVKANVQDYINKYGIRGPNFKLTPEDVAKVKSLIVEGLHQDEIAGQFNVTQSTISRVAIGVPYKSHTKVIPVEGFAPKKKVAPNCVLTKEDVEEIKHKIQLKQNQYQIAFDCGVSQSTVSKIARGYIYKSHG